MVRKHIWLFAALLTVLALVAMQTSAYFVQKTSSISSIAAAQPAGKKYSVAPGLPDINDIYRQINQVRADHGLTTLIRNDSLATLADQRARDMATNMYYGHVNKQGQIFDQVFAQDGYRIEYGCENLDLEFSTDSAVYINDWMTSTKGHRECILNQKVTSAGYAVTRIAPMAGEDVSTFIVVAIYSTQPLPK